MNWNVANATAMLRAPQVHRDLGIDRSGYVDVFAALRTAGLDCHARKLPRLFGFYFSPADNGPAVLLNANLNETTLRHTAAHELGHHVFDHGSRADTDLDVAGALPGRAWTPEEKQAESFAAWFLMPPPAVEAAMRRAGITRFDSPEQAYELAQWLGTSYAGTVRHLGRLRKISGRVAASWSRMAPGRVRTRLYDGAPARSRVLTVRPQAHGGLLHVSAGDVIVPLLAGAIDRLPVGLRLTADTSVRPGNVEPAGPGVVDFDDADRLAVEVTDQFTETSTLELQVSGHDEPFTITLLPTPRRFGVDKVWTAQQDDDASGSGTDDQ
ncbi:ImmA/IrrE family metallo-endopeptidase [Plantactinospora sp. KLBMP9567]|uniref:ImmA/IrrE family metallo-endopeptidase n=1 Tax=Plantactinospora sp. KLBMP9567 TaxID=3085900 RepID=UPI00298127A6|nr:ImmA/IrrE family metallo-endopeptidase [Plantactinospora sp. KLBMP9567]MDW5327192.1 ImmA/IrrE family metallo-endopeptidase [Plantactinospora sp. KLBMP9567]